jgi:glycogen debranching enzyme
MSGDTVSILEGDTFVVSDRRGDVDASPAEPHGLFNRDTRYLSRWRLTVGGSSPRLLSTDDVNYFSAQFFLVPPDGSVYEDSAFSIIRKRAVSEGFREDVTVLNHTGEPLELDLRIEAGADFADLFEVKDALVKKGRHYRRIEDKQLVLGYRRDDYIRETWITASTAEGEILDDGFRFRVRLEPHGEWSTRLDVVVGMHAFGKAAAKHRDQDDRDARPDGHGLGEWLESAPKLSSDWRSLELSYERSLVDLAALRFYAPLMPGMALPAAGLPWFMTVFGRDSLITSFQALPYTPELAETTLRVLAAWQGARNDDFRDMEPGKILHEIRIGEMTAFEERPHSPYYGSADSTPLFLVLLDETVRWTGDDTLARELEAEARAALAWIDQYGDLDGDGYVEYQRRNTESGLENQCWKDSHNSILFADGSNSSLPRATCEIQGYVYDAKIRAARLARKVWGDPSYAERLEREAAELKRNFNRDFWIADREYFALALDGEKRQVDSLTSNIGHLLWSGIVDDDKADAVARHLMSDRLFSGWGIRTMAVGDGGYNPIGYHNGTVWPHDNSLIAHGLARYGYRDEAARIAYAVLEAAEFFRHRLPEVFAGYPREDTLFPVEYPTACSPQAWASGAPLLFVTTMLGLEPGKAGFRTNAHFPEGISRIELNGISARRPVPKPPPAPARIDVPIASSNGGVNGIGAADLFAQLHQLLDPEKTRGEHASYRFEIVGVGTWAFAVDDGRILPRAPDEPADCVLRMNEKTFIHINTEEDNPMTAFLRGALAFEGDLLLASKLDKYIRLPGERPTGDITDATPGRSA